MPIDAADGYIHFSTAAQLPETLRLYFAGQDNLVLLAVRTYDLGKSLRLGALARRPALPPCSTATSRPPRSPGPRSISVAADGSCPLPADVR